MWGRGSRRRRTLLLVAINAVVFSLAFGYLGIHVFTRPIIVRIAIGSGDIDDLKVVQLVARAFAQDKKHIRLRLMHTASLSDGARMLGAGEADLAVVRADQKLPENTRAVAVLRSNALVAWLLPSISSSDQGNAPASEQATLHGLIGRRVGLIGTSHENMSFVNVVFAMAGLDPSKMQVVQFAEDEAADALSRRTVDAVIAIGPINSRSMRDIINTTARDGERLRFLKIESAEAIALRNSTLQSIDVPPGAFNAFPSRPNEMIRTVSTNTLIVTHDNFSDVTAANFARQLFSVRQNLLSEGPAFANIAPADTDKSAAIQAHRGAVAYFDDNERTFFDRYSDLMWGGIMLMSVLLSVGVWLRDYLKREDKVFEIAPRMRLVEMLAVTQQARSLSELDAIDVEAGAVLRKFLHGLDSGRIAQGELFAFSLVLAQLNHELGVRRATLTS